jgi:hypothetical protein
MKKLGFLTAAIWVIFLFIIPFNGFAKMAVMSDNELRQVTGQAGITIKPEDVVGINIDAESISYTDTDGVENGLGPFIALCDTTLRGSISAESIDYDFISQPSDDGQQIAGISFNLKDVEVNIDHFQTDIRLGNNNGSDLYDNSNSLGVFGMYGVKTRISGNMRVYTRQ